MKEKGLLERMFLCGLGVLAVAEEKVKGVLDELEEKGAQKEKELQKQLSEVREKDAIVRAEKIISGLLKRLDIPTASEIRSLRSEIKRLEELLREKDEKGKG